MSAAVGTFTRICDCYSRLREPTYLRHLVGSIGELKIDKFYCVIFF